MLPWVCMATAPSLLLTQQQYVELDERSERPLEYVDGEVFEIESSTANHAAIVANLTIAAGNRLKDTACRPFATAVRVRVPSGRYLHPDLVLVCGKKELLADKSLINPTVIFEVLSESMAGFDFGRKNQLYRSIPSLNEYILIEQNQAWAQRWFRQAGSWRVDEFSGLDATLPIATLGCEIPVRELYLDVEFEPG